jgi:hypothetical protein
LDYFKQYFKIFLKNMNAASAASCLLSFANGNKNKE